MDRRKTRWLLWVALASIALGLLLISIIDMPSEGRDNKIMQMVSDLPGWFFFVMVVLITPLLEECAFRSWIIGQKWAKYICIVMMSGFMASIFQSFWVFIVPLLLAANLLLMNKKPVCQTFIYVFLSSLFFSLAHKGNMDLQHYLYAFPIYFGLSLLFCFIGLRFRFVYCIPTHAIYNFTLITLGGFTIATRAPVIIEGQGFNGTVTQVSGFNSKQGQLITEAVKTIMELDSLNAINEGYKIETYQESYRHYNWVINCEDGTPSCYGQILKTFVEKGLIRIDTLKQTKTIRIFEE